MFKKKRPDEIHLDKHNRLMSVYKECPEWWYLIVLVIATGLSVAGIAAFPTYTTPGVVFYGLLVSYITTQKRMCTMDDIALYWS